MSNEAADHIQRAELISFQFDKETFTAHAGETIAAALLRAGITHIRNAPGGTPRGMFCAMGVCQECVVMVDGKRVEACRAPAKEGLIVQRVSNV